MWMWLLWCVTTMIPVCAGESRAAVAAGVSGEAARAFLGARAPRTRDYSLWLVFSRRAAVGVAVLCGFGGRLGVWGVLTGWMTTTQSSSNGFWQSGWRFLFIFVFVRFFCVFNGAWHNRGCCSLSIACKYLLIGNKMTASVSKQASPNWDKVFYNQNRVPQSYSKSHKTNPTYVHFMCFVVVRTQSIWPLNQRTRLACASSVSYGTHTRTPHNIKNRQARCDSCSTSNLEPVANLCKISDASGELQPIEVEIRDMKNTVVISGCTNSNKKTSYQI